MKNEKYGCVIASLRGTPMKDEKYGCVIASLRGNLMKNEKYGCVIASLRGNPIGRIVIANGMKQSLKKNT